MKKAVIIDARYIHLAEKFRLMGYEIIPSATDENIYESVSCHPDLQFFIHEEERHVIIGKQFYDYYKEYFLEYGYTIEAGNEVGTKYPENIGYNIVKLQNNIMHNIEYTDKILMNYLKTKKYSFINVKQGYTKCSLLMAGNKLITEDKSIYTKLREFTSNILYVEKGYVELPKFQYGFIGGATGFHENKLFLTGRIDEHPQIRDIEEFLKEIEVVYLSESKAVDVGTIFFLNKK